MAQKGILDYDASKDTPNPNPSKLYYVQVHRL